MNGLIVLLICFIESTSSILVARRAVGGESTTKNAFPFVVAIYLRYVDDPWYDQYRCTGSIIHKRWILTAAHCLIKPVFTKLAIKVGGVSQEKHSSKVIIYKTYQHPQYQKTPNISWNDVGLIKLKNHLVWTDSIQPIPLGSIKEEEELLVRYVRYGQVPRLNQLLLKTVRSEECRKTHARLLNIVDGASQFCGFTGTNKTLCYGDSGGPLIDRNSGKQVGVFSSLEDCSGRYPVIFTRVSYHLPWIRLTTKLKIKI